MAALAIACVWSSYTLILWGYCLVAGYDITLKQILGTTWPPVQTSKAA